MRAGAWLYESNFEKFFHLILEFFSILGGVLHRFDTNKLFWIFEQNFTFGCLYPIIVRDLLQYVLEAGPWFLLGKELVRLCLPVLLCHSGHLSTGVLFPKGLFEGSTLLFLWNWDRLQFREGEKGLRNWQEWEEVELLALELGDLLLRVHQASRWGTLKGSVCVWTQDRKDGRCRQRRSGLCQLWQGDWRG